MGGFIGIYSDWICFEEVQGVLHQGRRSSARLKRCLGDPLVPIAGRTRPRSKCADATYLPAMLLLRRPGRLDRKVEFGPPDLEVSGDAHHFGAVQRRGERSSMIVEGTSSASCRSIVVAVALNPVAFSGYRDALKSSRFTLALLAAKGTFGSSCSLGCVPTQLGRISGACARRRGCTQSGLAERCVLPRRAGGLCPGLVLGAVTRNMPLTLHCMTCASRLQQKRIFWTLSIK